jgi:hypothetical protein
MPGSELTQQQIDAFAAANDVQRNHRRFAFEHFAQFGNGAHALAVEANNDIVFMQAACAAGLPLSTLSMTMPLVPSFI